MRIDTLLLHARLQILDSVLATIVRADGLWKDVHITQSIGPLYTTYKIMSIPAYARGKTRESMVQKSLDEIQVGIISNPESMCRFADTRFKYFLIQCIRFSCTFWIYGLRDKTIHACINGIELIISTMPDTNRQPRSIQHTQ